MRRGELKNVATAQYDFAALRESRPVTLVGIKFDPKIRNIAISKFEPL